MRPSGTPLTRQITYCVAEHLSDLAASFRRDLRAEGRSERTGVLYGMSVRMFCDWLTSRGREPALDELNRAAIREWLAELAEAREASTVCTRFKGMHRFCGWLLAEGEIDAHPMQGMTAPVAAERPVPVLSDYELAALVKACAGKDSTTAATRPWFGCCSTPASGCRRRAGWPSPTFTSTGRWRW